MINVLLFELRYRLRQVSTYLFAATLFLMALLFISTDIVQIGGGDGRVKGNAPFVLATAGTILIALGTIICSATMGTAIYRDFETNTHELFFTTRLTKRDYVLGRFIGAFLVTLLVFLAIPFGFLVGTVAPWADKASFGPFQPESYLFFIGVYLIPNLLLVGALCFVFGALTRSLLAIYMQGILFFVGWSTALSMLSNLENRSIAAFLDPFGLAATALTTRYWTLAEKNHDLLTLSGHLLWNRLFWTAIGLIVFAVGYRLFTFSRNPLALRRLRTEQPKTATPPPITPIATNDAVGMRPSPFATFIRLTRFYFRDIVRGVPFLVISLAGILILLVSASQADKLFGTATYPVTRVMVQVITGGFSLFYLILITFYTGELTWRERVLRLDQVIDTQPISTAGIMLAKTVAVVLMLTVLNVVLVVTGVLVQAAKGYTNFELPLYLSYLFLGVFPSLLCLTFLAFFIHAVVNNKFLGHTAVILVFLSGTILPLLKLERYLYRFASTPDMTYSDMNGFGPFVMPVFWFTLYWLAVSTLLLVAALRLWVRGKDESLRTRWQKGQIGRWGMVTTGFAGLTVIGAAAYTLYNTDVLNEYLPKHVREQRQADFERHYKATWAKKSMPRVQAVTLDVDLHPETRQYTVTGTYRLKNKTNQPIPEIVIQTEPELSVKKLTLGVPATPGTTDIKAGFRTLKLGQPLAPGAETTLDFVVTYDRKGFPNTGITTAIADNGSFVTMPVPLIGYQKGAELSDENDRRKHGLPKRPRMAPLTDTAARYNTYIGEDADWIDFEATVRTVPDQTAIAPGYLQREWTENGRHCFHYKMDAPIRNFYSFLSARYAVKKDTWTSKDGKKVALEIYYHPTHTYNLDRMIAGMKAALSYCSENFSPFQFRQLRILEFPVYATFAQSFPNTIPFSEGIGFIARVDDKAEDIDYPFYVTAHETAHQWWAHQVLGADMEGSTMLSESLAEYSALKIMEKRYGADRIRKFLRYDLDGYLRGRGVEREAEKPLYTVENQPYIHYQKGALVFYALADRIGEDKLNATLARFTKDKGFQEPPYTTSLELLEYLRKDTAPSDQTFLKDLFEQITMFDLRATEAKAQKLPNGKWRVTVTVSAAKSHADGTGKEVAAPIDDTFDIGVFAAPEKPSGQRDALGPPLAIERHRMTTGKQTFTIDVDKEPAKAGIDPNNKMIDRIPSDNTTNVVKGG